MVKTITTAEFQRLLPTHKSKHHNKLDPAPPTDVSDAYSLSSVEPTAATSYKSKARKRLNHRHRPGKARHSSDDDSSDSSPS